MFGSGSNGTVWYGGCRLVLSFSGVDRMGGRRCLSAVLSILTFAAGCGVQQNFLRWLGTAGSLESLALGASSRSLSLSSGDTENDAICDGTALAHHLMQGPCWGLGLEWVCGTHRPPANPSTHHITSLVVGLGLKWAYGSHEPLADFD